MPIRFFCPTCNVKLKVPSAKAGAKGSCPGCGQRIQAPSRNKTVLGLLSRLQRGLPQPADESPTQPYEEDAGRSLVSNLSDIGGIVSFGSIFVFLIAWAIYMKQPEARGVLTMYLRGLLIFMIAWSLTTLCFSIMALYEQRRAGAILSLLASLACLLPSSCLGLLLYFGYFSTP